MTAITAQSARPAKNKTQVDGKMLFFTKDLERCGQLTQTSDLVQYNFQVILCMKRLNLVFFEKAPA